MTCCGADLMISAPCTANTMNRRAAIVGAPSHLWTGLVRAGCDGRLSSATLRSATSGLVPPRRGTPPAADLRDRSAPLPVPWRLGGGGAARMHSRWRTGAIIDIIRRGTWTPASSRMSGRAFPTPPAPACSFEAGGRSACTLERARFSWPARGFRGRDGYHDRVRFQTFPRAVSCAGSCGARQNQPAAAFSPPGADPEVRAAASLHDRLGGRGLRIPPHAARPPIARLISAH